jgi:GntR family transcriptional repressor for pyruvate dehydrogenase complex
MTTAIKLQPPRKSTVVESIIDQLVDQIRNGTLKQGDRLPSERLLIEMLGVSRSSVREALQGLAVMGLVEIRQGEGTFVKEVRVNNHIDAPIDLHPHALQMELRIQLNHARFILETGIVADACARITPNSASTIMDALHACYENHDDYPPTINWSAHDAIHLSIAQATGNRFLVRMLQTLLDFVPASLREGGVLFGTADEIQNKFQTDKQIHYGLCEAIAQGDEASAKEWMVQHAAQEERIIHHYYGNMEKNPEG